MPARHDRPVWNGGSTDALAMLISRCQRSVRMRLAISCLAAVVACLAAAPSLFAQLPFDRLSTKALDVAPPTDRVRGAPGTMTVRQRECRVMPLADVRRRIVDVAVQEWGFFGFPLRDEAAFASTDLAELLGSGSADGFDQPFELRDLFPRLSDEES